MAEMHEGGSLCGAVRYRAVGDPVINFCKRRTGSAFCTYAYFDKPVFEINGGILKSYEYRSDESNLCLRTEF